MTLVVLYSLPILSITLYQVPGKVVCILRRQIPSLKLFRRDRLTVSRLSEVRIALLAYISVSLFSLSAKFRDFCIARPALSDVVGLILDWLIDCLINRQNIVAYARKLTSIRGYQHFGADKRPSLDDLS